MRRRKAAGEGARETLASAAYEQLRREIITAALAPGEKLRIRQLCARYEMGLSPIREALNRMARDGLVRQADLRGFRVAPVSLADLEELTRARCWLAEIAIRQSIAEGDAAWEESVLLTYHRLSRIPRFLPPAPAVAPDEAGAGPVNPAWETAHRGFHASLVAGCGSGWIVGFCEQLFDAADRYRHLSRSAARAAHEPRVDEHRAIMEAAVARNADETVRLIAIHFRRTAELARQELGRREAEPRPRRRPQIG